VNRYHSETTTPRPASLSQSGGCYQGSLWVDSGGSRQAIRRPRVGSIPESHRSQHQVPPTPAINIFLIPVGVAALGFTASIVILSIPLFALAILVSRLLFLDSGGRSLEALAGD
jgi:hypothetical protein